MRNLHWKPALAGRMAPILRRSMELAEPLDADEPLSSDVVIASYNVHKCVGLDGAFDPHRTTAVIAQLGADIVALQEVDQRFGDRVGLMDLDVLEGECGLVPIPLQPTRKGHGWHGNLVLCRPGMVRSARQMALPGGEPRGALIVDMDTEQGPLRIVAAHLGLLRLSRARQVDAIVKALDGDHSIPTLLMGDLNEWRLGGRSSLKKLEKRFAWPSPVVPSFPAGYPLLPLDRIMATEESLIDHVAVHDSELARLASDHLPIKAWVNLEGVRRSALSRAA